MSISFADVIWSAVGTALITTISVLLFSEKVNTIKVVWPVPIIIDITGLHFGPELMK